MTYIPTKDEIKNQNALIGEFIICFERICAIIRFVILRICYPDYNMIQNNNIETLLEGLTSDPLRKKLEALIYDNFPKESDLLSLNKNLSNKFYKMITIRNTIAHGSMMLGRKSFDGKLSADTFLLKKSKITKTGIDKNSIIVNIASIQRLIKQAHFINNAYSQLWVLIDSNIKEKKKESHLERLKEQIDNIGTIKFDFENKITK
ncbi:MAG: hypothetical protein KAT68_17710 [Bacteroidales bacterium]|nr:hypothetical protein [Bacteroidales bacterium]